MNPYYPNLFSSINLAGKTVKNRIVLASMGEKMGNADGSVSEQAIAYYQERAKGGAGIIIPGVISVEYPRGKTTPCQMRLDQIKYVNGMARLASAVHAYGALLIPQLHHAGSSTTLDLTEGVTPVCVSLDKKDEDLVAIASHTKKVELAFHELTLEDIHDLEQKFIRSAVFAQMAGCDGVEIHGAHGYLVSQFLSSKLNQRHDEYGGCIENRARFAENIIKGIHEACGTNFIIGIRMPVHNWDTDGLTDEESRTMAVIFEKAGCNYLNASGGYTPTITNLLETQQYEQGDRIILSEKIKDAVSIPVMAAGVLREPEFCEKIIAEGKVDFALMGRTLLCDPEWPNKAKAGKPECIRKCISCLDACYGNLAVGVGIQCALNPEVGREFDLKTFRAPSPSKKVVVVGGGLAGLQAAITATERGHKVTVFEKSDRLGGQMLLAAVPPHKEYVNWAADWFIGEVSRKEIDVRLGQEATIETIKKEKPDAVIIAAGALPSCPPINGIENGIQAWSILDGSAATPANKKVVVLGGGIVGCETAIMMADNGCSVSILEMLPDFANGLEGANKLDMITEFEEKSIKVLTKSKVTKIDKECVEYEHDGKIMALDADVVVLALGQKSQGEDLSAALNEENIETYVVGDAKTPGKFRNATTDGYFAAMQL